MNKRENLNWKISFINHTRNETILKIYKTREK